MSSLVLYSFLACIVAAFAQFGYPSYGMMGWGMPAPIGSPSIGVGMGFAGPMHAAGYGGYGGYGGYPLGALPVGHAYPTTAAMGLQASENVNENANTNVNINGASYRRSLHNPSNENVNANSNVNTNTNYVR